MTGHRNTGRLNLLGAYFAAFGGLESEFSKIQCAPATGRTPHSAFLLLSKFYFFRAKHFLYLHKNVICYKLPVNRKNVASNQDY
jgi:hypothetical protein